LSLHFAAHCRLTQGFETEISADPTESETAGNYGKLYLFTGQTDEQTNGQEQ